MSKLNKADRLKLAEKIATENQVSIVYANSKDEFFTSRNHADNSDLPANIETFDFTKQDAVVDKGDEKKLYKLAKADMDKYPELAINGFKEGDEVEELDWACKNKKPEAKKA